MRLSFVTENAVDVASDVNQSLLEADGLIVSRVTGIEIAPPAVLIDGLRVAIASGATGAFAGKDGKIAVYVENGAFWQFYSPALCVFDGVTYLSAGGDWIQSSGGAAGEEFTLSEKQKLSGIADEATKNRADSENADKVHTHTASQVTGLGTAATKNAGVAAGNVMEVGAFGIGLTTNADRTNDFKSKGGINQFFYGLGDPEFPNITTGATLAYSQDWWSQLIIRPWGIPELSVRSYYNGNTYSPIFKIHHTGNILQTTGTSTEYPMSQKVTTDQLATKANTSTLGTAATKNVGTAIGDVMGVGASGYAVATGVQMIRKTVVGSSGGAIASNGINTLYVTELETDNYLTAIGLKVAGAGPTWQVLASKGLALGGNNTGGTQIVVGATNNTNVRMYCETRVLS